MNKFLSKRGKTILFVVILALLALGTRFWRLTEPAEVVFDEVHFGKFVSSYFTGEYFFDIHPPFGKLMMAGAAAAFGYRPNQNPALLFDHIGQPFDPASAFTLRFLPALAGTALVLIIFALAGILGASQKTAFFAGTLAALDNSLIVQSRFMFLDSFMLDFGLLAIIAAVSASRSSGKKRFFLTALAGALGGLAFGVKMTGAVFGAAALLVFFIEAVRSRSFRNFIASALILAAAALPAYAAPFALHFKLLPKSGPGNSFMTPEFNVSLLKSNIPPETRELSFTEKFIELNRTMYGANAGLKADHFNGSKWREWPVMRRPVWYWSKENLGKFANIYLLGNPAVWLFVLISVPLALRFFKSGDLETERRKALLMLFSGYILNLTLFLLVDRVAFLYHYLPSLTFGIILAALVFESLTAKFKRDSGRLNLKKTFLAAAYLAVVIGFLVVSPLTYGSFLRPETNNAYQAFLEILN